jgi:hypothetical protein
MLGCLFALVLVSTSPRTKVGALAVTQRPNAENDEHGRATTML